MVCNIMTGAGFDVSFLGGFAMAWLGAVVLFFIIVLARKWMGEEMGLPFSTVFSFAIGFFSYIILITIFCSYKIALVVGLIGAALGAYVIGPMLGDTG